MIIDEQDIFNFVKYPDKLTEEKKEYIEGHPDLFEDELDFLQSASGYDNSDLPADIKLKLHFKLLGKNPKQSVRLTKLASPAIQRNHIRNLAADSTKSERSVKAISFTDESNSYMIKALIDKDKTIIYVFSTDNKELKDFSLLIKPSGEVYHLHSNKTPLILDRSLSIESIDLF